eukprot:SAG11_NODE_80_length_17731_cov_13.985254_9_plen_201_part_00
MSGGCVHHNVQNFCTASVMQCCILTAKLSARWTPWFLLQVRGRGAQCVGDSDSGRQATTRQFCGDRMHRRRELPHIWRRAEHRMGSKRERRAFQEIDQDFFRHRALISSIYSRPMLQCSVAAAACGLGATVRHLCTIVHQSEHSALILYTRRCTLSKCLCSRFTSHDVGGDGRGFYWHTERTLIELCSEEDSKCSPKKII